MNDRIKDLLSDFRAGLEGIYGEHLQGIYLYGSYARGEEDSESDVDVLVVLDDFDRYRAELDRTSEVGTSVSLKHGLSVSQLFMRKRDWLKAETPFLLNIREEALPV